MNNRWSEFTVEELWYFEAGLAESWDPDDMTERLHAEVTAELKRRKPERVPNAETS